MDLLTKNRDNSVSLSIEKFGVKFVLVLDVSHKRFATSELRQAAWDGTLVMDAIMRSLDVTDEVAVKAKGLTAVFHWTLKILIMTHYGMTKQTC